MGPLSFSRIRDVVRPSGVKRTGVDRVSHHQGTPFLLRFLMFRMVGKSRESNDRVPKSCPFLRQSVFLSFETSIGVF